MAIHLWVGEGGGVGEGKVGMVWEGLWEAVAEAGARVSRGVAKHLIFRVGDKSPTGLRGSKHALDQGPDCLCTAHCPTSHGMFWSVK